MGIEFNKDLNVGKFDLSGTKDFKLSDKKDAGAKLSEALSKVQEKTVSAETFAVKGLSIESTEAKKAEAPKAKGKTSKAAETEGTKAAENKKGETYSDYKTRREGEKAQEVIKKYEGYARASLAAQHGKDYKPSEQEVADRVAQNLIDNIKSLHSLTQKMAADKSKRTIDVFTTDVSDKDAPKDIKTKLKDDLLAIRCKLSPEMQQKVDTLLTIVFPDDALSAISTNTI